MTERETEQTKGLADRIVEKFRDLFALESRVLEAREHARQITTHRDTSQPSDPQDMLTHEDRETLTTLETQLKEQIGEMVEIIDELKSATPSFRNYVLPQMRKIVETLKTSKPAEQAELTQLVISLMDDKNMQSLEQLEGVIITRLRDNLEKIFGV